MRARAAREVIGSASGRFPFDPLTDALQTATNTAARPQYARVTRVHSQGICEMHEKVRLCSLAAGRKASHYFDACARQARSCSLAFVVPFKDDPVSGGKLLAGS